MRAPADRQGTPSGSAVAVSAGVLVNAGRVLVCQRRADQPHACKWEFPGGKRDAGETMEECLRRELREELDIEADVGVELWRTEFTYPGRPPVALTFFRVDAYRGAIANRVFANVRWVPIDDLRHLDFLEADRAFITRLVQRGIRVA
jgi:mutator protein MutT